MAASSNGIGTMIRRLKSPHHEHRPLDPARFEPGAGSREVIDYLAKQSRFVVRFVPRPHRILSQRLARDWRQVSPVAVLTHIAVDHLGVWQLQKHDSVASFDIEVARVRGIALDWLVERMVGRMLQSDQQILNHSSRVATFGAVFPGRVRTGLARNLRFIEHLGCTADVSWGKIWDKLELVHPGCRDLQVDPDRHCREHLWKSRDFVARMMRRREQKRPKKELKLLVV